MAVSKEVLAKEALLLKTRNREKSAIAKEIRFRLMKQDENISDLLIKFTKDDSYLLNESLKNYSGYCASHFAAINYLDKAMKELIASGVRPGNKDENGNTCLHLLFSSTNYITINDEHIIKAAEKHTFKNQGKDLKLVQEETKKRKDFIALMPAAVINETNAQNKSPLHLALKYKLIDEAQFLIEKKGAIVTNELIKYGEKKLGKEHQFIKFMHKRIQPVPGTAHNKMTENVQSKNVQTRNVQPKSVPPKEIVTKSTSVKPQDRVHGNMVKNLQTESMQLKSIAIKSVNTPSSINYYGNFFSESPVPLTGMVRGRSKTVVEKSNTDSKKSQPLLSAKVVVGEVIVPQSLSSDVKKR